MENPIKIVSDGTPGGTKVFDKSGNEITNGIAAIRWSIKPDSKAAVVITFVGADVELVGDLKDG